MALGIGIGLILVVTAGVVLGRKFHFTPLGIGIVLALVGIALLAATH